MIVQIKIVEKNVIFGDKTEFDIVYIANEQQNNYISDHINGNTPESRENGIVLPRSFEVELVFKDKIMLDHSDRDMVCWPKGNLGPNTTEIIYRKVKEMFKDSPSKIRLAKKHDSD